MRVAPGVATVMRRSAARPTAAKNWLSGPPLAWWLPPAAAEAEEEAGSAGRGIMAMRASGSRAGKLPRVMWERRGS